MKIPEWNESFETGIVDIDIQHRSFFKLGKILLDAIDNNRESEVIEAILLELTGYTKYHIATEETYHKGSDENLEEHQKAHYEFIQKVSGFKKLYRKMGSKAFSEFMLEFLFLWIEEHIKSLDMRDLPRKK